MVQKTNGWIIVSNKIARQKIAHAIQYRLRCLEKRNLKSPEIKYPTIQQEAHDVNSLATSINTSVDGCDIPIFAETSVNELFSRDTPWLFPTAASQDAMSETLDSDVATKKQFEFDHSNSDDQSSDISSITTHDRKMPSTDTLDISRIHSLESFHSLIDSKELIDCEQERFSKTDSPECLNHGLIDSHKEAFDSSGLHVATKSTQMVTYFQSATQPNMVHATNDHPKASVHDQIDYPLDFSGHYSLIRLLLGRPQK